MSDGVLLSGNSKLFEGPLGVVKIGFKGYDLGKTTEDSNLTPDQDIKDIIYQQDGTKAADHVRTGIDYTLSTTFGQINTGILKFLMAGVTSDNKDPKTDYGVIGRSVYQSMRAKEAGVLKVVAVDDYGIASVNPEDQMWFYEAIALIEGELVNWGADTQRNLPVNFRIKFHVFEKPHNYSVDGAFGYWGDPASNKTLPAKWPDTAGPRVKKAVVKSTTTLDVTFNENIDFLAKANLLPTGSIAVDVDGKLSLATSAAIVDAVLTATFPANTFKANDVVELTVTSKAVQDEEDPANPSTGVDGFTVENPLT